MMQLETAERSVGGFSFTMTRLTATESRKLQVILLRALGPTVSAFGKKGLDEGAIGDALAGVLRGLQEEDLKQVVGIVSRSCRVGVDGANPMVSDVYDLFFSGKALLHWKWLGAFFAFEYSDFLGGRDLGSLFDELQAKFMSTRPKASTSTSGDPSEPDSAPLQN